VSKCKDCGDDWNQHVPIGFCVASGGGYDQCGCDSIPEGTWVTVDSLAEVLGDIDQKADTDRIWRAMDRKTLAAAIIRAAKEAERE
jgi:hypothetical protein